MNIKLVVPDQCHSQETLDSCVAQQVEQLELRFDIETTELQDFRSSVEQSVNIFIQKVLQQFHLVQIYRKIDVFNRVYFLVKLRSLNLGTGIVEKHVWRMIERFKVWSERTNKQMFQTARFSRTAVCPLAILLALLSNKFCSKFHPPGFSLC